MPTDAPRGPRHRAERPRREPGTRGRHVAVPAPGRVRRAGLGAAAVAAIAAAPVAVAPHASAATDATWDRLAACASKGQWTLNSGDGRSGGLQLNTTLWDRYGGDGFARVPYLASREQQIAVGEGVLGAEGWSPWNPCANRLALTESDKVGSPMPVGGDGSGARQGAAPAGPASGRVHVVRYGDTLSSIGAAYHLTWEQVYDANRGVVGVDPDRIVVGQRLVLPVG